MQAVLVSSAAPRQARGPWWVHPRGAWPRHPGASRHTRAIVAFSLLGNEGGLNIVVDFNRKCFQIEMTLITAGCIICCE